MYTSKEYNHTHKNSNPPGRTGEEEGRDEEIGDSKAAVGGWGILTKI